MQLSGLGIVLRRLRHEDIEKVRQYRNDPDIRQYMEFREEISATEQERWFQSINNANNFYFIIENEGRDVGLIYGQHTDWNKLETGNGGIFIWDKEVRETQIPVSAALLLTDFSWLIGLKKIHAKILRDNHRAIAFNQSLGYVIEPGQAEIINQHYTITPERFGSTGARLVEILARKFGSTYTLSLHDRNDPATLKLAEIHASLPEENKKRLLLVWR